MTTLKHVPESVIFSCDPGSSGGFSILSSNEGLIETTSMPPIGIEGVKVISDIINQYSPTFFIVEEQAPRRGNGMGSVFTAGFNYSFVITTLWNLGVKPRSVNPKAWYNKIPPLSGELKGKYKPSEKETKIRAAEYVLSLYPHAKQIIFSKRGKLLDGISDSIAMGRVYMDYNVATKLI